MFREMKTVCPSEAGAGRRQEAGGKIWRRLLCVRQRFDETRGVKLKTVEIIVEEKPLHRLRYGDDELVPVSVSFDETELRQLLKEGIRGQVLKSKILWV